MLLVQNNTAASNAPFKSEVFCGGEILEITRTYDFDLGREGDRQAGKVLRNLEGVLGPVKVVNLKVGNSCLGRDTVRIHIVDREFDLFQQVSWDIHNPVDLNRRLQNNLVSQSEIVWMVNLHLLHRSLKLENN